MYRKISKNPIAKKEAAYFNSRHSVPTKSSDSNDAKVIVIKHSEIPRGVSPFKVTSSNCRKKISKESIRRASTDIRLKEDNRDSPRSENQSPQTIEKGKRGYETQSRNSRKSAITGVPKKIYLSKD